MKFNEVNKTNLVKNTFIKQKNIKQSVLSEQKRESLKNVPNNPFYWQNLINLKSSTVSFGANNGFSQSNIDGKEIKFDEKNMATVKPEVILGKDQKIKKLKEKGVDSGYIKSLAELNEKQFAQALILLDRCVSANYVQEIAKLGGKQFENALKLMDKGVELHLIKSVASLGGKRFENALVLIDKGIVSASIASLNDEQFEKALKIVDKGVENLAHIKEISALDEIQFEKAQKLLDKGVKSFYIKGIVRLGEMQFEKAQKLLDKGVDSSCVEGIAELNEKQFENAEKLLDKGVDSMYISRMAKFDEVQVERALILTDKGISPSNIEKIVRLDETQFENALKLTDKGVASGCIEKFAKLPETQFQKVLKLIDDGVEFAYINDLVQLDEMQFERALILVEKGVSSYNIEKLVQLDETQFERALILVNKGVDSDNIKELVQLDEMQFENALIFADKGVDSYCIKRLAQLDETQFERALILADKSVAAYTIKELALLNGIQFEKALILADKGIASGNIKELAQLEEPQFEKTLKLIDKCVSSNEIKNVVLLDEAQYEKALILADKGVYSNIKSVAQLDETQFEKALILADKGFLSGDDICDIINSMLYEATLKHISMGIEIQSACKLARLGIDLSSKIGLVEVPKQVQTDMFKNFFANNSNSDEIIKNADFAKYEKEGIPLEYSRTEFLDDLSSELLKLPTETQSEIINKLGIKVIQDENGNITGYDGIIDLTKLSSAGDEGKVLELANHFILNNKVVTGDSEVDNMLNSLISGMPEFINTIGKQQHNTHSYSLDIHILETYKAAISDFDYKNLSDHKKFELKLMAILHDISKQEISVDNEHPLISAKYAKDILSRYPLSDITKYDVVNNILNHHWGKDYNMQAVLTEETAVKMGSASNYEIQKIFAKADLIGMGNSEFSSDKLEELLDSNQARLLNTIINMKKTAPLVYTTPIIKPDLIPSKKITLSDGTIKTIKSLNLSELPDDYDMEKFGFLPNTKAKDVTFGVHTANSQNQFDLFEMLISNPITLSPQSVSIISKNDNAMFKRFGVAVELSASDVINATPYDQGSGVEKTENKLIYLATGSGDYEALRKILPNKIKKRLGIGASGYSQLVSIVENYKYLTQINDTQKITLGEKTFTGSEIKTAILTAQNELMQMATNRSSIEDRFHSEGDITELVVKKAKVMDNTYIVRYNSADDVNNENIPSDIRKALCTFLSEIPENSTVIFAGYDGYLYSSKANQWNERKKPTTDIEE